MITITALTPTCRSMTFGTSTWFSNCCCTRKKIATPSASVGDTVKATATAGIAASSGPTIGIISPIAGDQRQHVEVRHAHQPQAERRGAADDAGEQQLPAEPGADLGRDAAAGVLDARPLGARKQPHERPHDAVGVDAGSRTRESES